MVGVLALGIGFLTFAEIHAAAMGVVIGTLIALLYSKKSLASAIGVFAFLTGFILGAFAVGPTVGLAWAGFWHPWYILFPTTIVSFLFGEYLDNG